jgi:uncharacterized protein YyaL (SSP411 family)
MTAARTRHRKPDGTPVYTNHLQGQTSPYLLQHVHNPVDWWPWGEEAFAEARRRDVPVFLSVGYSTCHWCHVMEEESFEDEDVASVINERFVAIKVDREERPDVDALYMTATQALTGHGGWPMTVFLVPSTKQPFFAGTYFPARDGDRGTRLGFRTLCVRLHEAWTAERQKVESSAQAITDELLPMLAPPAPADRPGAAIVDDVVAFVDRRFDERWGGLTPAPKFPSSTPLRLLLKHAAITGNARSKQMALSTLRRMIDGGIHDQAGGGFHRYSVDEQWLVPHFEKMLYDNALLVPALVEAWQVSGDDVFKAAARDTLGWMSREMSHDDGGFFSATDADSLNPKGEREEGWFFTWTPDELAVELGDDDAAVVAAVFDVTGAGNFEGRSILWHKEPIDVVARRLQRPLDQVAAIVQRALPKLLNARNERPAPLRDDKVLCAWNGLAISAFARAAFAFDDAALAARAVAAFDFVWSTLRTPDGRLRRSWKDGVLGPAGVLDDHAFVCRAALDLFELRADARYLDAAIDLDGVLARRFEDTALGGFFLTADDGEALLVREKPDRDGAEPSGSSIHAESLARLAMLTGDDTFRQRAELTLRASGQVLQKHPHALSEMVNALLLLEGGKEIVVVTPRQPGPDDGALVELLRKRFVPARVVVVVEAGSAVADRLPLLRDRACVDGKATAYVCERGACQLPVTTARALLQQLGG